MILFLNWLLYTCITLLMCYSNILEDNVEYLYDKQSMCPSQVYEYDDFYFMTDPEQLIYSHWAQRDKWQLLSHPLSLAQFEELPLVKSYFFKCGMYFVSHQKGVISTQNGRIAVTCGFVKPTNFTYKITLAENGDENYNGQRLKNYALQETQNDQATFILRAPKAGMLYFLKCYFLYRISRHDLSLCVEVMLSKNLTLMNKFKI